MKIKQESGGGKGLWEGGGKKIWDRNLIKREQQNKQDEYKTVELSSAREESAEKYDIEMGLSSIIDN